MADNLQKVEQRLADREEELRRREDNSEDGAGIGEEEDKSG